MPRTGESRIVITGIGVVSPFGVGRERFWHHISRGCSGTRTISEFDASELACRVAASVGKVSIEQVMREIWPFYGVMFFVLMLVTYIPAISLWLPHSLGLH